MEPLDLEPGDARLARVWPVLRELRDHLSDDELARRHAEAAPQGYRVTAGEVDGQTVVVAGWRVATTMAHGRVLHVDDLVTAAAARGRGHGAALLAHLEARAAADGCARVRLDSGVSRHAAHRFSFRAGYHSASHAFAKELR